MRGALDDPDLVLKGLIGANVAGFVVGAMFELCISTLAALLATMLTSCDPLLNHTLVL